MKFGNFPHGRKLDAERPGDYLGTVRTLAPADPGNIAAARKFFVEAKEDDFAREGRVWVDRGSGLRYRHVDGAPLAATDPRRQASLFVVVEGAILFLQRDGVETQVETVEMGSMSGHLATGHEPAPIESGVIW
jgi:hypothetical protein